MGRQRAIVYRLTWAVTLLTVAFTAFADDLPSTPAQPDARHVNRAAAWQRTEKNILSSFVNMYHATVLQVSDTHYPFRMWFFGWAASDCNTGFPGCDAIFHARGKDLDTWEVYCGVDGWDSTLSPAKWAPVITPQDKLYDQWHNGDSSVVRHSGKYYMAYSATGFDRDGIGFGQPGDTDGDLYCIMGAVSNDGITWKKTLHPLLIYPPDIGKAGDPNSDATVHGMYHRPSLLFNHGRWRLWFDYWTGTGVAMGYAEAPRDGFVKSKFTVLHANDRPLLHEWPNPSVVKTGNRYYAFADPSGYGIGWPGRQLAEAQSPDGIHWTILGYLPPDFDTPACHVPSATVILDRNATKLVVFYACQIGGTPYDYRYNRIRYMHRTLTRTKAVRK